MNPPETNLVLFKQDEFETCLQSASDKDDLIKKLHKAQLPNSVIEGLEVSKDDVVIVRCPLSEWIAQGMDPVEIQRYMQELKQIAPEGNKCLILAEDLDLYSAPPQEAIELLENMIHYIDPNYSPKSQSKIILT